MAPLSDAIKKYRREWIQNKYRTDPTFRAKRKESGRQYNIRLRDACWAAYGNKCSCCGETRKEFFSIDHINNDGAAHRKTISGGMGLYQWLKKNNYPKDRFRLLCFNCNLGRSKNGGICPHEIEYDMLDLGEVQTEEIV